MKSPVKKKIWNYWDYIQGTFNHRYWCLATTVFSPQFALHLPCRVTFKKHVEQQASLLLSSRLLSYDLSLLFFWDCALITDHLQRWTGPSGKSVTFVAKNPLNMLKNTVGTMELLAVTTAKRFSSIATTMDWWKMDRSHTSVSGTVQEHAMSRVIWGQRRSAKSVGT